MNEKPEFTTYLPNNGTIKKETGKHDMKLYSTLIYRMFTVIAANHRYIVK